ncbi:HNH endonuclease [Bdellovibrio bacteriovorus]|nr:HNH endonuclease signature motif containing protein [Bdellovibrio bacteriovorus]
MQPYRPYISVKTKRLLLSKAQYQCEHHHPHAGRCRSKYQLQVDHIQPLSAGGDQKISNLRILCGVHNRARN